MIWSRQGNYMDSRDIALIDQRVRDMRITFQSRDHEMERVSLVRRGDLTWLAPELFSDDLPHAVVANTIDVVARDLAEVMAPLPNLDCAVGNGITATDKKRAEKKNRIGSHYWASSKLQRQMYKFADYYNSYGVAVFMIEPDFQVDYAPAIRIEDPRGFYYRKDREGNVVEWAKVWHAFAGDLAAKYPEYESQIMVVGPNARRSDNDIVQMVRWGNKDRSVVYLPECSYQPLASAPNPISRVPVVVAERGGLDSVPRGQFADVIWVQLAKAIMAQYTLNAADKAVNAPIVLPKDVTKFAVGGESIISTDNPSPSIGRMRLDVPGEVFAMGERLDQGLKEGARYPEARTGGIQGSIVTGRGIEQLLGTFDTQLKAAQDLFKTALEDATSMCFEMDVALWPNLSRTISGVTTGRPYELNYVPARDIGTRWSCEVTYGFAAGMGPAQAMVALLQLRGDKLIGRDTARSQMPFPIDPEKEQRDLDAADLSDALMQGLLASVQAIGPMIQQGMPIDKLLMQTASVLEARQKGVALHEAIVKAFKPEEPPPAPELPPGGEGAGPPEGGAGGELPPGIRDNGLPQGVAFGQQGMAPGGMPALQSLIAGLRGQNAEPRMIAETRRMRPIGMG
ncbi:MAG: hypothetical protein ACRDSH_07085 [Pseudonocardiaceae bacterium]